MSPEKALHLGVDPATVQITARQGTWEVFVMDGERKRVLTEGNVFYCTQWRAKLERMSNANR